MANNGAAVVRLVLLVVSVLSYPAQGGVIEADVIIVGAGACGIQAGRTLTEGGVTNFVIVEATGKIGGRIRDAPFAGLNIELGANWVEGVNGKYLNPVVTLAHEVKLRTFTSLFENATNNIYDENGYVDPSISQATVDLSNAEFQWVNDFAVNLTNEGLEDISTMTAQRFFGHVPSTPIDMALDGWNYDFTTAEPPRINSLKNTQPLATETYFGPDHYFVADERGYAIILDPVSSYLTRTNGIITDPRLYLNTVVNKIEHNLNGDSVTVYTENGLVYKAKAVILTVSIGVLQSKLIEYVPDLPYWKLSVIFQFDMAVYTKIFLKFPYTFWPVTPGSEYFLYADEKRGYYPFWQHLNREFPGQNLVFVTVTDDEARRIEQLPFNDTLAEIMVVMRKMFGPDIPDATDILYYRWWKDRLFRGTYSNWPIGVSTYEYKQLQAPVGRLYFSGEANSELFSGYVHGALLEGESVAKNVIKCLRHKKFCNNLKDNPALTPPTEACHNAIKSEQVKATRKWSKKVDDLQKKLEEQCT
ncbi:unnamed protein product [Calypogeia fissa]